MLNKHWYVVFTNSRCENKVVNILDKTGIEYYYPTVKVQRQWSDRKKVIVEPLFKSYVFVRASEVDRWEVRAIPGVVNYVQYMGKPAVIHDKDILAIRTFLETHGNVTVSNTRFTINDKVKITSGLFVESLGDVVSVKGKLIQIQIPVLNLTLFANLDTTDIKLLMKAN